MTESNLEALQSELEETREALWHHLQRRNYHQKRYLWLKAHYRNLAEMLPGLVEAEAVAARAWSEQ